MLIKILNVIVIMTTFLLNVNAAQRVCKELEGMSVSHAGVKLIERFEGFRSEIYECPAGEPTIGYGHVVNEREKVQFAKGLSQEAAEALLVADLNDTYVPGIKRKVQVPLTQWQFDAIASLFYNVGETKLKGSTILRLLNNKDYDQASLQFPLWRKAGGKVLNGLVKRRFVEMFIFRNSREIPQGLEKIETSVANENLLKVYQALPEHLKKEADEIYEAYKANRR